MIARLKRQAEPVGESGDGGGAAGGAFPKSESLLNSKFQEYQVLLALDGLP